MAPRVAHLEHDERDPIRDVMPVVSRALKRGDLRGAHRALARVVGRRTATRAIDELLHIPHHARVGTVLTPAEWAAVWNAACGLTAAEAGERFHRSTQTVMSHRKAALRRLGTSTMPFAVAECYRRGIFDEDDPLVPVDW